MKKKIAWTAVILFGLLVAFLTLQMLASERVEVIELHTLDENGETNTTRLWIVDHEGVSYLRSGAGESAWLSRAMANNSATIRRNGKSKSVSLQPREDMRETVNYLLNEKYTWGDDWISLFIDRNVAIPIAVIEKQP